MIKILATKKVSILVSLVGIAYVFLFLNAFVGAWDFFLTEFHEGAHSINNHSNAKSTDYIPLTSYGLSLKPMNDFSSSTDSLVNLKTNQVLKSKYSQVIVLAPSEYQQQVGGYYFLSSLISLIVSISGILVLVHFYKLMASIKKEVIFERRNINLIRRIGFELLVVYFGTTLGNFVMYKINTTIFNFSGYEIKMESSHGIWLILGIVVLLIAEILSKAISLKEEQELTI